MNIEPATYVVIHHSWDWDVDPEVVLSTIDLGYAMTEAEKFPYPKNSGASRHEHRVLQAWHKGHKDVEMYKYDDGTWESEVFDDAGAGA